MLVGKVICTGPCSIDAVLDVDDSCKRVSKGIRVDVKSPREVLGVGVHRIARSIGKGMAFLKDDTYWRDEDLRPVRTARCRGGHRESRCVPLPVTHTHTHKGVRVSDLRVGEEGNF